MKVVEILNPGEPALQQFLALAAEVYRSDPVWVPQSQATFQQSFAASLSRPQAFLRPVICVEDGRTLARAVAILEPGAVYDGHAQGYIGFFECLPQAPQAGRRVLEHCELLLCARGARSVQAPRVDNMLMGLLVKGFDLPQTILTAHNPPYYEQILRDQGYQQRELLYTYVFSRGAFTPFPLALPGLRTRSFDRRRLDDEIVSFNRLQQEIFSAHPGYVPRSLDEDRAMIESFLPMLDDELVIFAEDRRGNPVGLLICLPDIYQSFRGRPVDGARLISIGAIPRLVSKGIGALMGMHLARNLLAKGYQTLEASWTRQSNILPQNLTRRFGGRPGREFALFEKALVP